MEWLVIKKLVYLVIILIPTLFFTACSVNDDGQETKTIIDNTVDNSIIKEEVKALLFKDTLLIDKKPVLGMTYSDIIKNFGKPIEECIVWRFDLTSDKYSIGDLKVGMSIEEYQKKFTDSKVFTFLELLNNDSSKLSGRDLYFYSALKRILIISKPKDYYSKYENASYQQGVLINKYRKSVSPLGFGILIKDNKINRIVYGFPNAS